MRDAWRPYPAKYTTKRAILVGNFSLLGQGENRVTCNCFPRLARISHGIVCFLGTPISRLAFCHAPIRRLAFPGLPQRNSCQPCVVIGKRFRLGHMARKHR